MASTAPHLAGTTVLDLSSVGPASRASRVLADYGAQVIKVGPTSKKGGVQIKPVFFAYGAGRGMKRVRMDLKTDEGKAALFRLIEKADVLIESFRPGVATRIGIGYDACRAANKRIVYCSTSGYGQDGPASQWAGHDINYLALGGFMHCSGRREDGGPAIPGATVADSAAGGMQAVIAIMAALLKRNESDEGEYLDVSVADGVLQLMSLHIDRYLATGEGSGPGSDVLTGRYAYYDVYQAKDGKWLSVGAIEPAFFANLCEALGCSEFVEHQNDDARQDEIRAAFAAAFKTRDRDDWVADLAPDNTCVAPVYDMAELTNDQHLNARGVFAEARHTEHGTFKQVGPVWAGCDRDVAVHDVRDDDATDTQALLLAAGASQDEVDGLFAAGVVE
jgi:alpha-methylacyl-CoA racemase